MIKICSFSYKYGGAPKDVDVVIDCRDLPNPHHIRDLRDLDGRHLRVQEFVQRGEDHADLLRAGMNAALNGRKVAFGCVGGKHRSVAMAEMLAHALRQARMDAQVEHRAIS